MKLQLEPREIDLYVDPKKLTEKEMQELRDFIREYKHKKELKKAKHKKAA